MKTSTASTRWATRSASSKPSSPEGEAEPKLSVGDRAALVLQREVGRLFSALWVPAVVALMRYTRGWRIADVVEVRRRYREVRATCDGPLLICANHLTMLDSAVIAWALGSPWWYLGHYSALPWNVPEERNFATSPIRRLLVYLMKCVPIVRGGDRKQVARTLARVAELLRRGEVVLIFPEGGRSRSGRVEVENAAHGVGRLIAALPGCRVLCVYLRGDSQAAMSDAPARNERFRVELSLLLPESRHRGVRRSLDLSQQVLHELAALEGRVLGASA